MPYIQRILLILFSLYSILAKANPPDLMLLGTYHNQNVQGWVMSEKLDGIRGYWDGKQLFTRQNKILTPPSYFIKDFPPFAIDGELFSQRNAFEQISSIVRSQKDKGWEKLKLYVFDVPNAKGNLFERLAVLENYLAQRPSQHIEIIKQIPIEHYAQVQDFLREVEQKQGEGLVLRNPNAPYENKRSQQILKLKTALDEECEVIAHHKGKGQFADKLGAITCKNQRGEFRIGSGFKLADRENPPPIGSIITYKYRGLTQKRLPRFATYWRKSSEDCCGKNY
ncbi:DNA ligase [Avibacterium avium]|uniref:DNA ligase n=1 Tax=Avibacterium avium TaxID=751 RepID=UPI003BF7ED4B